MHCSPGSLALLLTLQWPEIPVSLLLCSSEELGGEGPSCSFRGRTRLSIEDEEDEGRIAATEEHMLLLTCISEIELGYVVIESDMQ